MGLDFIKRFLRKSSKENDNLRPYVLAMLNNNQTRDEAEEWLELFNLEYKCSFWLDTSKKSKINDPFRIQITLIKKNQIIAVA